MVTVGMVADVFIGSLERYGAVTGGGEGELVQGLVVALRGANARNVIAGVRAELDSSLQAALPEHVTINVFYDRSHLVNRAVSNVSRALVKRWCWCWCCWACFWAVCGSALTVALILPLSALLTFIAMQLAGMSANLMSLGGLAIAIGLLVDGRWWWWRISLPAWMTGRRKGMPRLHIDLPGGKGSGAAGYLRYSHYYPGVFALAGPAGPGGQAVPAGGADHRICAGRIPGVVADRDPGAGLAVAAQQPA